MIDFFFSQIGKFFFRKWDHLVISKKGDPSLLSNFWMGHPALFYGISLLLGIYGAAWGVGWVVFPCFLLWFFCLLGALVEEKPRSRGRWVSLFLSILVFGSGWATLVSHSSFPHLEGKGVLGTGLFWVERVGLHRFSFGSRWVYRGKLERFYRKGEEQPIGKGIPCAVSLPFIQREGKETHLGMNLLRL